MFTHSLCFSLAGRNAGNAARVLRTGAQSTLHGLFSRFCVRALRCTAHSTSKTRVNALAEALRCVRDTRSLVLRAYGETIQLQPITL